MLRTTGWAMGLFFLLCAVHVRPGARAGGEDSVADAARHQRSTKLDGPAPAEPLAVMSAQTSPSLFYVDADYLFWWVHPSPPAS